MPDPANGRCKHGIPLRGFTCACCKWELEEERVWKQDGPTEAERWRFMNPKPIRG